VLSPDVGNLTVSRPRVQTVREPYLYKPVGGWLPLTKPHTLRWAKRWASRVIYLGKYVSKRRRILLQIMWIVQLGI
jgi:hypothetical protein